MLEKQPIQGLLGPYITKRLAARFTAEVVEVINESHLHAGHAGDDGSGESHFRIILRADELAAMSRVARHRAVYAALGVDLTQKIHAIALDIG